MADKEVAARAAHNVIMENRRSLSLSGVRDVDSFDEQSVVVVTDLGELTVRGEQLHISRFDQETGELDMNGAIDELAYSEMKQERKGLFARLMR